MNEKLEKFLQEKRTENLNKTKAEKDKILIDLGLYEKIYSPDNSYSEEYSHSDWDSATCTTKYYKKMPYEVTEEEYTEIKKYASNDILSHGNAVASVLTFIAFAIYVIGFIVGCIMGEELGRYDFSLGTAFIYWIIALVSGTTFLGFAEIIKLLNDIKNK